MTITVYSTPSCPHCRMTKRQMDKWGVAYRERALTRDVAELFGVTAAPMVTSGVGDGERLLWAGGVQADRIRDLGRALVAA